MPPWPIVKVRSKKVIQESQKEEKRRVHFATPMDICHQELEVGTEIQKDVLCSEVTV